ncbi:hypothetical protein ACVWZ8_005071 [Arthrobacter sp. UYCu723]
MSDWGWNPASFGAVGTVTAAFMGTLALLNAARQYGLSLRLARESQLEKLRKQADLVTIRIIRDSTSHGYLMEPHHPDPPGRYFEYLKVVPPDTRVLLIEIANRSDDRIFLRRLISADVLAHGIVPSTSYGRREWDNSWEIWFRKHEFPPGVLYVKLHISQGTSREWRPVFSPRGRGFSPRRFGLVFTDDLGTTWTRRLSGELQRGWLEAKDLWK